MVDGSPSDFLVIGTGNDQPGFNKLANHLPVSLSENKMQVHDTEGLFAPLHHAWWKVQSGEHEDSGN